MPRFPGSNNKQESKKTFEMERGRICPVFLQGCIKKTLAFFTVLRQNFSHKLCQKQEWNTLWSYKFVALHMNPLVLLKLDVYHWDFHSKVL